MFHVERSLLKHYIKNNIIILFFLISSCGISKVTTIISDYLLISSNGKKTTGSKNLIAFVFENNFKNLSIEEYLTIKYNFDDYQTRSFWVTIKGYQYYIMVYDKSETEKYFDFSNFILNNMEPEGVRKDGQSKFIAISMINDYNEDCLAEDSLYKNIAVNYLKQLKDEYYNY